MTEKIIYSIINSLCAIIIVGMISSTILKIVTINSEISEEERILDKITNTRFHLETEKTLCGAELTIQRLEKSSTLFDSIVGVSNERFSKGIKQ